LVEPVPVPGEEAVAAEDEEGETVAPRDAEKDGVPWSGVDRIAFNSAFLRDEFVEVSGFGGIEGLECEVVEDE